MISTNGLSVSFTVHEWKGEFFGIGLPNTESGWLSVKLVGWQPGMPVNEEDIIPWDTAHNYTYMGEGTIKDGEFFPSYLTNEETIGEFFAGRYGSGHEAAYLWQYGDYHGISAAVVRDATGQRYAAARGHDGPSCYTFGVKPEEVKIHQTWWRVAYGNASVTPDLAYGLMRC